MSTLGGASLDLDYGLYRCCFCDGIMTYGAYGEREFRANKTKAPPAPTRATPALNGDDRTSPFPLRGFCSTDRRSTLPATRS